MRQTFVDPDLCGSVAPLVGGLLLVLQREQFDHVDANRLLSECLRATPIRRSTVNSGSTLSASLFGLLYTELNIKTQIKGLIDRKPIG